MDALLAIALAGATLAVHRWRTRPTRRDLGTLPPDWRPIARTVVQTHHLRSF